MARLLIYAPSYALVAEEIARRAPTLEVLVMDDKGAVTLNGAAIAAADAAPDIVWADHRAFLGPAAGPFFAATLGSARLTWVQSAAAGYDHPLFKRIVAQGARLSISHGQATGMADYVLWGVLDHLQGGPQRRADQAAKFWRPKGFRELNGSSWLIIGFGAIGQAVAMRARAFGARITGVRRDLTPHPLADALAPLSAVAEHLPSADVVVLATPLYAATRRMANAAFFGAMKAGSVLVNVGRGGLVDEDALLAALDRGAPEQAVLDVFAVEPLPAESPFWTHPHVTLTPHASGITAGQDTRNTALFLDNLSLFVAGAPLLNLAEPADVLAE